MRHPDPQRFSALLDEALTPGERLELESHLRECQECSSLLNELKGIRQAASELPERVPPRDLWPGIARAIQTPAGDRDVIPLHPDPSDTTRPKRRGLFLSIPQAVAAGLALAILSGTVGAQWSRIGDDPEAEQQAHSSGAESAAWVRWVAEADPSLEGRAREVARLEAALLREGQLTDPTAVQVVQRNLAVIDRAIQESASALLRDPGNRFLGQSLARALQARADYVGQAASLTFPAT